MQALFKPLLIMSDSISLAKASHTVKLRVSVSGDDKGMNTGDVSKLRVTIATQLVYEVLLQLQCTFLTTQAHEVSK